MLVMKTLNLFFNLNKMKKIIAAFGLSTLLFGCNFGSGPAEVEEKTSIEEEETTTPETIIDNDLFVKLSAEILCLPTNHPEADADEIEMLAEGILLENGVSEADFSDFQQSVEDDPDSKEMISLAIVGQMEDFCEIEILNEEDDSDSESEVKTEESLETETETNLETETEVEN